MAVLSLKSLPLGFRFRPTDEELINYYLRLKINGNDDEVRVIKEIDVCKVEPWELPGLSVIESKDPEWFFFCPQDRKYPNGQRLNRATKHGYWKATGKDRKIKSGLTLIGMKKTLVFYIGRAPKGQRTYWVMHEYRPTLKELDGTNPGQNAFVICRLFKKQEENLDGLNCDEGDQTMSTPAKYSPGETVSDPAVIAPSPVPNSVTENSDEVTSDVISPVNDHNNGCDAYDAKNQIVKPTASEVDQPVYLGMFCNPSPITVDEPINDKVFSPEHAHMPPDLCHQVNYTADGHFAQQLQYGTTEDKFITDFMNSVVNWDDVSFEESAFPNAKDNSLGSNLDMEMAIKQLGNDNLAVRPEESMLWMETAPEFGDNEHKSNIWLVDNNSLMASCTDVSVGQVYNAVNSYEQPANYNTVNNGDNGTGIKIRTRQVRNEQTSRNPSEQGTAPRRIRLQRNIQVGSVTSCGTPKDESCASVENDSKPIIAGEEKTLENYAADEGATDAKDVEPSMVFTESADISKISQQHVTDEDTTSELKETLLCKTDYTSKSSSKHRIWSSVIVFCVILFLAVVFANIWGYLRF